jgi:hypothetical protein
MSARGWDGVASVRLPPEARRSKLLPPSIFSQPRFLVSGSSPPPQPIQASRSTLASSAPLLPLLGGWSNECLSRQKSRPCSGTTVCGAYSGCRSGGREESKKIRSCVWPGVFATIPCRTGPSRMVVQSVRQSLRGGSRGAHLCWSLVCFRLAGRPERERSHTFRGEERLPW